MRNYWIGCTVGVFVMGISSLLLLDGWHWYQTGPLTGIAVVAIAAFLDVKDAPNDHR